MSGVDVIRPEVGGANPKAPWGTVQEVATAFLNVPTTSGTRYIQMLDKSCG